VSIPTAMRAPTTMSAPFVPAAPMAPTTPPTGDALVLHPDDTVATALRPLPAGHTLHLTAVPGHTPLTLTLPEPVALCHKFALRDIAEGEVVTKYGQAIGRASRAIGAGAHVHVHNLRSGRGGG
jgi:hypothetical protein